MGKRFSDYELGELFAATVKLFRAGLITRYDRDNLIDELTADEPGTAVLGVVGRSDGALSRPANVPTVGPAADEPEPIIS